MSFKKINNGQRIFEHTLIVLRGGDLRYGSLKAQILENAHINILKTLTNNKSESIKK